MSKNSIKRTGFTTEIDDFLRAFDKKRTKIPLSIIKEINKAKKISTKRDGIVDEKPSPLWRGFDE